MSEASTFAYFKKEPTGFKLAMWITGKKLDLEPPVMEIMNDEEHPAILTDQLLTILNVPIFSPRLVQVFQDMGIDNVDYYPIRIRINETEEVIENYRMANIIGLIDCLDEENSQCTRFSDGVGFRRVKKFRLLEDRVPPDTSIFRLGEFPFIILAHESIKERCEREGIVGAKFVDPSKYVGV
jgi:hypothetical protein